jgi:hypothetical protein
MVKQHHAARGMYSWIAGQQEEKKPVESQGGNRNEQTNDFSRTPVSGASVFSKKSGSLCNFG